MLSSLIVLAIVVGVVLWAMGLYNGLVTARNAFRNASLVSTRCAVQPR